MVKAQTNEVVKVTKASAKSVAAPKEKKAPKKESKKTAVAVTETCMPATAESTETVVPVVAEGDAPMVIDANTALTNQLLEKRNDFNKKMTAVNTLIGAMKVDMKAMDKLQDKMTRELLKKNKRKLPKNSARQPIGFTKPTMISADLANFLGLDPKEEISRVDVCKMLYAYIKTNKLQDPTNGRHIIPNDPLRTLLGVKETDDLTYFNLQSFLRTHFLSSKNNLAAAAAAASTTA